MTPADEAEFIRLWNAGTETAELARQLGLKATTAQSRAHRLQRRGLIQPRPRGGTYPTLRAQARTAPTGTPEAHRSTPATSQRHTGAHSGTPLAEHTQVHPGTPNLLAPQPTAVHQSVPLPHDVAVRLLSLLPDLEVMVARERDRQRLRSTPVGTPQHTVKKTYVVEALYVDLIERYAKDEGVELKDVVNLAFQEFFERRQYLPEDMS